MPANYYDTLGVPRNVTPEALKKAFHSLIKLWHPDRNKTLGAKERSEEIINAYRVLSDPEARAKYDRWGHVPEGTGAPLDMVTILAQIFKNVNESIKIQKNVCPVCLGKRWVPQCSSLFALRVPCPKCSNGSRNIG